MRMDAAFQIMDKALAYGLDTVTFSPLSDFWGNSLYHAGEQPPVTVKTTSLANLLQERNFDTFAADLRYRRSRV